MRLSKTTAAGGGLIKIPLCAMGRQMGGWKADAGKPEATAYVPRFTVRSGVCPLAVNVHRDLA